MATINVLDSVGATVALEKPLTPGRTAAATSRPVALSTEDKTALDLLHTDLIAATPAGTNLLGKVDVQITGTAPDLGPGTGGTRTLRVAIDSAQLDGSKYETVAASATAQVLGGVGAIGDYISGILVIPATTSPGNVLLLDNATSITVFTGGATSVSNLVPFFIPLGMFSVSGAWKLTTGASVSCIGIGNFT